jgi:hypothetical protein
VREWPIGGNAIVKTFELDGLFQCETDQDEIAGGIQDEVVIIIRHSPLKSGCRDRINQLLILS